MPINYSLFAFPKGTPRVVDEHRKGVARETALDQCYAKVDRRDEGTSWVTGKILVKSDRNHATWLTRHHLRGRLGEHRSNPHEVITVSWTEHQLLESCALIPVNRRGHEVADARTIAGFAWNRRLIAPNKEPFRIPASRLLVWREPRVRPRRRLA